MDTNFLLYQKRVEMWELLKINWMQNITTITYWGIVTFIIFYYVVWYRLADKRRLVDLLLYGSLFTVVRSLIDLAGVTSGLWVYKVRILALSPSVFLQDWTIMPLTYMLVQQYSSNWRQFFLWNAVGTGFISFVIMPILTNLDILVFMHWNYIYTFLVMYIAATLMRAAFHLVVQVQEKARKNEPSPLQRTLMQPSFKPTDDKETQEP